MAEQQQRQLDEAQSEQQSAGHTSSGGGDSDDGGGEGSGNNVTTAVVDSTLRVNSENGEDIASREGADTGIGDGNDDGYGDSDGYNDEGDVVAAADPDGYGYEGGDSPVHDDGHEGGDDYGDYEYNVGDSYGGSGSGHGDYNNSSSSNHVGDDGYADAGGSPIMNEDGSYYYDENGNMVYDDYCDDGIEYEDYNDQGGAEEVEYGDYNDNQEAYYPSDDDADAGAYYAGDGEGYGGEAGGYDADGAPVMMDPMMQLRPQEIHKLKDTKQYNRWYLQRRGTECYMPILFEDGMDYTECELYYKSINSQLNYGGSITTNNLLREWNRPFDTKVSQLHRITNRRRFSASSISSLKQSLMLSLNMNSTATTATTATNDNGSSSSPSKDNTAEDSKNADIADKKAAENDDANENSNNNDTTKQENFLLSCLRTPHPRRLSLQQQENGTDVTDDGEDDGNASNEEISDDDFEDDDNDNDENDDDEISLEPPSPGGVMAVRRNSFSGTPQLLGPDLTSILARSHSIHSLSVDLMDFSSDDGGNDDDFANAGDSENNTNSDDDDAVLESATSPPLPSPTTVKLARKPPARTKSEPLRKNSKPTGRITRTKSGDGLMTTSSRRRNNRSNYSSYHTPAAEKKSTSVKFMEYVKVVTIHPAEDYPDEVRLSMWMTRQEMSQNMRRATMKQHKDRRKGRKKKKHHQGGGGVGDHDEEDDDENDDEGDGGDDLEERRERARQRREARKKKAKKQREEEQDQTELVESSNTDDSGGGYGEYESTLAE